jgi:hypothetical protein
MVGEIGIKQINLRTFACAVLAWCCSACLNAGASPPSDILIQPTNQIAAISGTAVFSATAEGTLPFTYQWYFMGKVIDNATNSTLTVGPIDYAQDGYYDVMVGNASGTGTSSTALLNVSGTIVSTNEFDSSNFQAFVLQFTNMMAVSANSGTVCGLLADGKVVNYLNFSPSYSPTLTNITAISSDGYGNNLALKSNGTVAGWNFSNASETNVPAALSNVTAVAVGSPYGYALRSDGTVVWWPIGTNSNVMFQILSSNAVAISAGLALYANGTVGQWGSGLPTPPVSLVPGLSNVIAIAQGSGNLAVLANGTVVGWGGLPANPLPNLSNVVAVVFGDSEYLALESDGNVAGTSPPINQFPVALSSVFALDIDAPYGEGIALFNNGSPVFKVQPGGQVVTNGGTIWLHARAVGAQPISYQWLLDGTILPDATNADLTITNAQGYDTGQYSAVASNQVGFATSLVATVTIPFSYTPANLGIPTIMPDGNLLFNVYSTNGSLLVLNNTESLLFQASSNLIDWTFLTNALTLTNGGALLSDPNATNSPVRFYRLIRE